MEEIAMGRPKGFKLSDKQKQKMKEGRQRALEARREGMVDAGGSPKDRKQKKEEFKIIGYVPSDNGKWAMPVFSSERKLYPKIYKTIEDAKKSIS